MNGLLIMATPRFLKIRNPDMDTPIWINVEHITAIKSDWKNTRLTLISTLNGDTYGCNVNPEHLATVLSTYGSRIISVQDNRIVDADV